MRALNTQLEQYNLSHHNFIEAYQMVNEYVAELYKLPKKLVEDAGNTFDNLCGSESEVPANVEERKSWEVMIDFMDQLDNFTVQTIQLFKEHKAHVEHTQSYIRKISTLQINNRNHNSPIHPETYKVLSRELENLVQGLRQIKEKADGMVTALEKLELRWENTRMTLS